MTWPSLSLHDYHIAFTLWHISPRHLHTKVCYSLLTSPWQSWKSTTSTAAFDRWYEVHDIANIATTHSILAQAKRTTSSVMSACLLDLSSTTSTCLQTSPSTFHGVFIEFFPIGTSRSLWLTAYNRDFLHEDQSSTTFTRAWCTIAACLQEIAANSSKLPSEFARELGIGHRASL